MHVWPFCNITQVTFTFSKSTIETLEKKCEICSKLTIKTPEQFRRRRSIVVNVSFEHVSQLFVVFLLVTLTRQILVKWRGKRLLPHFKSFESQ